MKSIQKRAGICILAAVFSIVAAYLISRFGGNFMQSHFGSAETCEIASESDAIDDGMTIEQKVFLPYDHLTGLGISIAHLSPDEEIGKEARLSVSLFNAEKERLCCWETEPLCDLDYQVDSFGKLKPQAYYFFSVPGDVFIGEGEYTLVIGGVKLDKASQIGVAVNAEDVYIRTEGELIRHVQERFLFTLLYVIAAVLIVLRMLFYKEDTKEFVIRQLDRVIIAYTLFLFTFTFTYFEDTIMIYENARVMKSAIKHGEFFRYYDYAMIHSKYRLNANYNVILYLIFAVCFLPYDIACTVFGEIPLYYGHMWYNIIVSLMYVLVGMRIGKLLDLWQVEEQKKKTVMALYYLNPVLLFSTVGFSQLDIFYIAVFVEGLILFEKKETDKACLIWALSVAMKMFPVLVVIPLILLREKKLLRILRYVAETMSITIVCHFIYGSSEGWIMNQEHSPHYERLFADLIPAQHGYASIFIVLYLVILFCCWNSKRKESYQTTILCGVIVYISFFCFCNWLAQYVALMGLFIVLAALVIEDFRIYLGVEAFLSLGYILAVWLRSGDGANLMLLTGCIGGFRYVGETPMLFSEFVNRLTGFAFPLELAQSISVAAGLFLAAYCMKSVKEKKQTEWVFPAGYLYLPMLPVYAILMLSGIITFSS